ncbi:two-component system response regulator [Shewanella sp. MEBiC00475]|uniref:response regulator n=1 Tax=Shewanella sp. MEBiC00475 TaxID=2575361 RepID=UPI0010C137A7|nr:two-component system response regulator [Shewanella sp. MEBiC00475]
MQNSKATILVVDDTPENIDVLSDVLRGDYRVKAALSGKIALKIANTNPKPDLILLDVMMPDMDGYEVCEILKKDPVTSKIPIIFVTAKTSVKDEEYGLTLGAVDYVNKPISPSLIKVRVKTHLDLYDQSRHLEKLVQARTSELQDTRLEIIRRLGRAAEYKDNETGLHVIRMSKYSELLASKVSNDKTWVDLIYNSAAMHDVGKIGIPDHILRKPGKLDSDEWCMVQKHCEFGSEIIGEHTNPLLRMAREVALYHHEKWNGDGYPFGLKGDNIPLSARVIAIADVFDALTSIRPYKKAWSLEDTMSFIVKQAGIHFDPSLVPLFVESIDEITVIMQQYSDSY